MNEKFYIRAERVEFQQLIECKKYLKIQAVFSKLDFETAKVGKKKSG